MPHLATRSIALILLPLALGGSLAACGSNEDEAAPQAAAPAATPAQDAVAATSPEATPTSPDTAAATTGHDHSGSGKAKSSNGVITAGSPGKSTDVDAAFLRQMVPHHQLAVIMGTIAARQAEHQQLKIFSSKMIVTQGGELKELGALAKQFKITPGADAEAMSADSKALGISTDQMQMAADLPKLAQAKPFDKEFLSEMIAHHEGAIAMAKVEAAHGKDGKLKRIARDIVKEQSREIQQLTAWQGAWY